MATSIFNYTGTETTAFAKTRTVERYRRKLISAVEFAKTLARDIQSAACPVALIIQKRHPPN